MCFLLHSHLTQLSCFSHILQKLERSENNTAVAPALKEVKLNKHCKSLFFVHNPIDCSANNTNTI
jgi:hypothetical protein